MKLNVKAILFSFWSRVLEAPFLNAQNLPLFQKCPKEPRPFKVPVKLWRVSVETILPEVRMGPKSYQIICGTVVKSFYHSNWSVTIDFPKTPSGIFTYSLLRRCETENIPNLGSICIQYPIDKKYLDGVRVLLRKPQPCWLVEGTTTTVASKLGLDSAWMTFNCLARPAAGCPVPKLKPIRSLRELDWVG